MFLLKGNFYESTFEKGIDIRLANFDVTQTIFLEKMRYPSGKFHLYWRQLQRREDFRIKLLPNNDRATPKERFTRLEIVYKRLRNNFIAQDDLFAADAVMYELAQYRSIILDEFFWNIYGQLFGYGYKPWRFLTMVAVPIIALFAFIWYWFYYGMVLFINDQVGSEKALLHRLGKKQLYLLNLKTLKK